MNITEMRQINRKIQQLFLDEVKNSTFNGRCIIKLNFEIRRIAMKTCI